MAAILTNNLPAAALPVLGTDLATVSRDGINVNKVSVSELTAIRAVSVADEGTTLTPTVSSVNFVGAGVTATSSGNAVTVTIPGGGGGGGSLTGFAETSNTAAPNDVRPVNALSATGAATDIDVAVVPKGTGAFALNIADNGQLGGNKRGARAVDLQLFRINPTEVASGDLSFAAGFACVASGAGSVSLGVSCQSTATASVAIGNAAKAFGNSAVSIGRATMANGQGAVAMGDANTASTDAAFAAGSGCSATNIGATAFGISSTASGANSFATGFGATTNGINGQVAFGHSSATLGGFQTTFTGIRATTNGTTPVRAVAGVGTGSASNQLALRNNSAFKVIGDVVARDTVTNDSASFTFSVLIKRGADAASTAIVGTPTVTREFNDAAAATWTVSLSADTTNGALAVTVAGAGANDVRWTVELYAQESN